MLSPIVLFVYNRPKHTAKTLNALMNNELADQSVLYIYADGNKVDASEKQQENTNEVRKLIRSQQWCKEVHIVESETNKGLANSIITGVSDIVNQYGKIIVMEDDIVTSPGFLRFMNDALDVYENNQKVMHISGYMYPHKKDLPETFFFNVPLCWGWATWSRSWKNMITDTKYLYEYFENSNNWTRFNAFGGSYLKDQLMANLDGSLNTWFIKWHSSVLLKEGYTLYPRKSLVENIGFDNSGEHCSTTDRFNQNDLAQSITVKRIKIKEDKKAKKIILEFYQGKKKRNFKYINRFLIPKRIKALTRSLAYKALNRIIPELSILNRNIDWTFLTSGDIEFNKNTKIKIYSPFKISSSSIGDYTYIASNSRISYTEIGKFCSIGPNLFCGWGIHPIKGISTSPMFYSTSKQNGNTLSETNKIEERKPITIGNDVFIGANVTIIDGVKIGDGAIIGAGSIVSKDIPPYAIAVGSPIQIINYRFTAYQIDKLLSIKWWNFNESELKDVESLFFNIDEFIEKYYFDKAPK